MTWTNTVSALAWVALIGILLFATAGTLHWPQGWIFMAEFIIGSIGVMLWLARHDPGLLKERMGGAFQKGQVFWDRVFMGFIIVFWYGWLALMGVDGGRWHLYHMPAALEILGSLLIPLGFYIVWLTFRENSFAAPVIKIQKERGQRVISTGPYAVVRHPMYAGAVIYMAGMPLLLGSWLGVLGLPLFVVAIGSRIFIEEAALRQGIAGYEAYAAKVRYRLIPGVW
jgi:protein-S-isoprenylcysteine O-methyltransferase Ste14